MIRYALKCSRDHSFESWFQSAEAFEKLQATKMVVCTYCGCGEIEKALMAPRVRPARTVEKNIAVSDPDRPLSTPQSDQEIALAKLKSEIESKSEYVGMNFAKEARAIHDGDAPGRSIYGEAKPEEAKSLIEDGVPVAPLPFMPDRKTN